jgi:nucleoid DNA-binding protein
MDLAGFPGVQQEKVTVTKKEIVRQIADQLGKTQLETKKIVQLTFDAIIKTLMQDKRIELRNFGVFEVKQRKARKARNPRTGTHVDVPPKNVVTFKPGKEMEEKVRQLTNVPPMTRTEEPHARTLDNGALPTGAVAGDAQSDGATARRRRARRATQNG